MVDLHGTGWSVDFTRDQFTREQFWENLSRVMLSVFQMSFQSYLTQEASFTWTWTQQNTSKNSWASEEVDYKG